MQVKVKRAKDLPAVTHISTVGYTRAFPSDQQEFILDSSELAIVLHDGNMEFVEYIDENGVTSTPSRTLKQR